MATDQHSLYKINASLIPKDSCIVVVHTLWNASIVNKLLEGCIKTLSHYGMENIKYVEVPGAFEIPFAIKNFWDLYHNKFERPTAFIALGCVLRGDTPHFDYVCQAVTYGISQLNLSLPVPSIFGVLTIDNEEQAFARTGGEHGNKGEEAALSALKMIEHKYLI